MNLTEVCKRGAESCDRFLIWRESWHGGPDMRIRVFSKEFTPLHEVASHGYGSVALYFEDLVADDWVWAEEG